MEYERFYQFFKDDDNPTLKNHKNAVSEIVIEQKVLKNRKLLKNSQNL